MSGKWYGRLLRICAVIGPGVRSPCWQAGLIDEICGRLHFGLFCCGIHVTFSSLLSFIELIDTKLQLNLQVSYLTFLIYVDSFREILSQIKLVIYVSLNHFFYSLCACCFPIFAGLQPVCARRLRDCGTCLVHSFNGVLSLCCCCFSWWDCFFSAQSI